MTNPHGEMIHFLRRSLGDTDWVAYRRQSLIQYMLTAKMTEIDYFNTKTSRRVSLLFHGEPPQLYDEPPQLQGKHL